MCTVRRSLHLFLLLNVLISSVSPGQSASDIIYDIVVDEARPSTSSDRVCNDKLVGNPLLKGSFSYRHFDLQYDEGDKSTSRINARYDYGLSKSIKLTSRLMLVKGFWEPDYTLLDGRWHSFGPPSFSSRTGDEEVVEAFRVDGNTRHGTVHFEACLYGLGSRPVDYEAFIARIDTTEDEISVWASMSTPEGGPFHISMPAPVDWWGYELVVPPPYEDGYPCGDPGIVLDYDADHDEYHLYPSDYTADTNSSGDAIRTKICSKGSPACSAEIIFELMLSEARFVAPTAQQHRVKHCSRSMLSLPLAEIPLIKNNPIRSMVSSEVKTVTNYTVPGHLLHPGRVVRMITEDEDGVYVETWGEGTGNCLYSVIDEYSEHLTKEVCEHANEYLAPKAWPLVDKLLKERYDQLLLEYDRLRSRR